MPLSELQIIERLRRMAQGGPRRKNRELGGVLAGIGDDCAVLRGSAKEDLLVTTDFTIEGVHFRRDWHPAEMVGHRCLLRGLSDLAAMGGAAEAAFLSLGVPADLPQKWVDGFMKGWLRLARRYKVQLAGGDTAESPQGIAADAIVLGRVPKGTAVMRAGARAGDLIYVTGQLGGAAAELRGLFSGKTRRARAQSLPRIEIGRELRERELATAMIDVSDGLSSDLAHICEQSGVGAEIEAAAIPVAKEAGLRDALHGGEDYELLFTALGSTRVPEMIAGVRVTLIGEMKKLTGRTMWLRTPDGARIPLAAEGWEHFRN